MNVTSDVAKIPGWYGKLPTLGDFASRRLEADFIEPWDLWLGDAMQVQRQALGDAWVEAYLDSPPWRFLLAPGVLPGVEPTRAFAGVLVPSVDRVGRYFPLTIAASLPRVPEVAAEFDSLLGWMHRLEDTALDALQGDWSIDDLEHALADLSPPTDEAAASSDDRLAAVRGAVAAAVSGGGGFVDIASITSRAELATVFSSRAPESGLAYTIAAAPALHGIAFWIDDSPARSRLLVSEGLPGHDDFARMFGGGSDSMRGAAARAAPFEEDPQATLPQALDAPIAATARRAMAEETDLLGMFQASSETASAASPRPDPAREGDDILALFGAGDVSAPFDAGPPSPPKDDDILAMFEAPSGLSSTQASHESPEQGHAQPNKSDILDLFGGPPAEPDTGKAR
ncbi:MAG: type VI secretion system-associated protein TagF [Caldimonas sp.]